MALSSQALTTVEKLTDHLHVPSDEVTAFTTEAELLIEQATANVQGFTNRKLLLQETDAQIYSGAGGTTLFLREYPAVVTSVVVDGVEIPEMTTWEDTGWFLDPETGEEDCLRLNGYDFTPGYRNVEVYGSFGYLSTSQEGIMLERAALEWAAYFYKRPVPGVTTENFEGVAVTYGADGVPRQVERMLQRFRKWEMG